MRLDRLKKLHKIGKHFLLGPNTKVDEGLPFSLILPRRQSELGFYRMFTNLLGLQLFEYRYWSVFKIVGIYFI